MKPGQDFWARLCLLRLPRYRHHMVIEAIKTISSQIYTRPGPLRKHQLLYLCRIDIYVVFRLPDYRSYYYDLPGAFLSCYFFATRHAYVMKCTHGSCSPWRPRNIYRMPYLTFPSEDTIKLPISTRKMPFFHVGQDN